MARYRRFGINNPLVRRVKRHASVATLFRSAYEEPVERPRPSPVHPRLGMDEERAETVHKAALLPPRSSLPQGLTVPGAGVEISRRPQMPQPFVPGPETAGELQPAAEVMRSETEARVQPLTKARPEARTQAAASEAEPSKISESDWSSLQKIMQRHQEKLAREKEEGPSEEQIQRAQEEKEREAARQRAEDEAKRRQELARSGKLPKAQVVYLSPEEPATIPTSTGEETSLERGEGKIRELERDSAVDLGVQREEAEPVETVQREESAQSAESEGGALLEVSDRERPEAEKSELQMPPSVEQTAGREDQDLDSVKLADKEDTAVVIEPLAETEIAVGDATEAVQEPGPGPSAGEEEQPVTEEGPGLGQRLIAAARSVFRRTAEPDSPAEQAPLPVDREDDLGEPLKQVPEVLPESSESIDLPDVQTGEQGTGLPGRPSVQIDRQAVEPGLLRSKPTTPAVEPAIDSAEIRPPDKVPAEHPMDAESNLQPEIEVSGDETLQADFQEAEDFSPETTIVSEREPSPQPEAKKGSERPSTPVVEAAEDPTVDTSQPVSTKRMAEPEIDRKTEVETAATEAPVLPDDSGEISPEKDAMAGAQAVDILEDHPAQKQPALPMEEEVEGARLQQLPLDEAWPVKRVKPEIAAGKDQEEVVPQAPASAEKSGASEAPHQAVQRKPAGEALSTLQTAMDKVSPGKPSDSSIELVHPSRPRPEMPAKPDFAEDDSTDTSQRPQQRLAEEPVDLETRAPTAEVTDVVREAAPPLPPESGSAAQEMVRTDIGDLPADLWDYLGQIPPAMSKEKSAGKVADQGQTGQVVQREEVRTADASAVEKSTVSLQPEGLETALPWIQRAEESEQAPAVPAPEGEEFELAAEGEEGGLNLEAVAREILPLIKRKLSVEWERNRGRF